MSIVINHLTFAYTQGGKKLEPTLKDISFTIEEGTARAFDGRLHLFPVGIAHFFGADTIDNYVPRRAHVSGFGKRDIGLAVQIVIRREDDASRTFGILLDVIEVQRRGTKAVTDQR